MSLRNNAVKSLLHIMLTTSLICPISIATPNKVNKQALRYTQKLKEAFSQ
jgi:hypothetical protein